MDEFECIAEIRRRLQVAWTPEARARGVAVDIGDDAAVLWCGAGQLVASVDTLVEGVHFRWDWLAPSDVGFRGISAAVSDLAAMGARPTSALLSLIVPATLPAETLLALVDGVAEASSHYGMPVVGGNLSQGGELSMTTTVLGEVEAGALLRSGARPGDRVYVSGRPGMAALGLQLLTQGRQAEAGAAPYLARWRRPEARVGAGQRLRGVAHAAIDLSDGLLQDLSHLCDASGVGARLHARALPADPSDMALAKRLGLDWHDLALTGGEDYELLFTAAPDASLPVAATPIGSIATEPGILIEDSGGQVGPADLRGFRHAIGKAPGAQEK
jgi:thiamine-monophosphate kinase